MMDPTTQLLLQAKTGDKSARDTLIEENLGLVHYIVKRFLNRGYDAEDLFQIGCIGLMKSIDQFDVSYQVKFSTYAVPMIIGEIRRYLRDNNSIRVSRSLRDTAYKAIYAREAFIKQNNREPSVMEVAGEIGISKEDVVFAMDAIQSPMSLYEPVYSEGGDKLCIMDQVKDTKNTEASWVENIALRDAIERLGDRERKIIDMRFFEGKTQMEVAAELAISQAQISRIEKNALKSMRTYLQQ